MVKLESAGRISKSWDFLSSLLSSPLPILSFPLFSPLFFLDPISHQRQANLLNGGG